MRLPALFLAIAIPFGMPTVATAQSMPVLMAQQVNDVDGWNGTTWGMTQEQVLAVHPEGAVNGNVINAGIMVEGKRIEVIFNFSDGALSSVFLKSNTLRIDVIQRLDRAIEPQLRARYGEPHEINSIGQMTWYLPSTEIKYFASSRYFNLGYTGFLTVLYERRTGGVF